ncbi:MAG: GtrA family protein [Actinobacteria bacterium]|nr:GtrA family protein [Actinomycetota bacterium]
MSIRVSESAGGAAPVAAPRIVAPFARRWPDLWTRLRRFTRFGLVGVTGIVVNEGALAAAVKAGAPELVGVVLATQCSTLWNFALVERWAFRGSAYHRRMRQRLLMFLAVNNAALLLRGPIILGLKQVGVGVLIGNLVSLLVLIVVRFALSDTWIWGKAETESALTGVPEDELATLDGSDAHVLHLAAATDTTIGGAPPAVERTGEVRARYADDEVRDGSGRRRFPAAGTA